jgi:hypothetical protein
VKIEFLRTRKIGVAGAGRGQVALGIVGAIAIFHRESFLPIFPVAILETHRDGRPNRLAMPHAGKEVCLILLDTLASSAPEPQLAAVKLAPHELEIDRDARRQTGKPGQQGLPVGFPGSDKSQHVQLGLIM